jgi:S-methylmethionine-dependent homocysteine/selenocysteine methylase
VARAREYSGRMADFRSRLRDPAVLLLDGATGGELDRRGVDTQLPLWSAAALWNAPDALLALHREYVAAGAEVVTANTFRTQARTFAKAGRRDAARDWTRRAVELARASAPRFVAGSMAPLEECYSPALVPGERACAEEHGAFAADLAAAGVDLILIETMNTIREAVAAARAATATGLPTVASVVCGSDGRLLSGERVADAAQALLAAPVVALAVNCTPAGSLARPLQELLDAVRGRVPCGAYGNVGSTAAIPAFHGTRDFDPDSYATTAVGWVVQGARIVGGCCGTGPEHVAELRRRLDAQFPTRSPPPRAS